jgi:hypothetical protein
VCPPAVALRDRAHAAPARHETVAACRLATIGDMTEAEGTLREQLDEIGVQLAWVRDYL